MGVVRLWLTAVSIRIRRSISAVHLEVKPFLLADMLHRRQLVGESHQSVQCAHVTGTLRTGVGAILLAARFSVRRNSAVPLPILHRVQVRKVQAEGDANRALVTGGANEKWHLRN